MMRWLVAVAFVGLAVAVSGCAGSDSGSGDDDPTGTPDGGVEADPYAEAAEWQLGQWFQYRTQSPDGETADVTLVVTNVEAAANYTLDTTDRDMAAFHAESAISFVGPIQKTDLAGVQAETPVRFFRFPLDIDTEWTTQWDGETRTVRVVEEREDFRRLTASAGDVVRVDYSYRPEAGFFGHVNFFDEAGAAMFTLTLSDWGENFTGPVVRATFEELFSAIGGGGPSFEDFMVPNGTQELVLRYNVTCPEATAGGWQVSFTPLNSMSPHEDGHEASGECPEGVDAEVVLVEPPPGVWEYAGNYAGITPDGSGGTDHAIFGAARTFQEIPAPAS